MNVTLQLGPYGISVLVWRSAWDIDGFVRFQVSGQGRRVRWGVSWVRTLQDVVLERGAQWRRWGRVKA